MKYAAAMILITLVACKSQSVNWADHGIGGNGGNSGHASASSVGGHVTGRSAASGGVGHGSSGGHGASAASGGMSRR